MTIEDNDRPSLKFSIELMNKRHHPVVVMPGFVTTGLELWRWKPCMKATLTSTYRQRIFGMHVLGKLISDPDCVLQRLTLDPDTAADPDPGIKVRADSGFDSVDSIMGYWVWAKSPTRALRHRIRPVKIFGPPATTGGFSPALMNERDGFFSLNGERAVILTHSLAIYGSLSSLASKRTLNGWCGVEC